MPPIASILSFPRSPLSPLRGREVGGEGLRPNPLPTWDPQTRALVFDGHIVKYFRQRAESQERILTAFKEEGWPVSILDPLPPQAGRLLPSPGFAGEGTGVRAFSRSKRRLNKTIEHLNRARTNPLISFHGDGSGQRISWRVQQRTGAHVERG